MVTDNTKTRVGKDFYDKYFYKYIDININANDIVTIGEEFSYGRNIKLSIEINNEVIYEFMARPDDEFLDEVASEAVKFTYFYFKEKEKQSKYFTQY
ncbi:CsgE family curli-type amyloid fiber assembly protein [Flavobacterium sp. PL12]|uniref:CsgE family curli-type amyloid fiber assembly protein n=1 Tax=Flavobacterium sp. PL12 TaxID=3071718 RepID=UPI00319E9613